ncbi:PREDICTED: uncharacterized protein LOC105570833, partial [Vollenhovia emeryi]|uniref:uncharacterized protein LOC105570833 n=1 Tax=Vollenhovia emeryi TaxID=411798 RepID=UPI0005F36C58
DYEEASKKRKDADLFSDIENIEKNKHTRKERKKKAYSSDNSDSDESYSPPTKVLKVHSKSTTSQSHQKNITSVCDKTQETNVCDINTNNSYNPPCKIITDSRYATSHKNVSTKIVNNEETINSEQFCNSNSESELRENESNVENVDETEFSRIKENDHVNAITSKNRISTNKKNMLPPGECEEITDNGAKNRNDNSQTDTQQKGSFSADNLSTVLRLILTKQNKIVKQNEIIMTKITILEKKVSLTETSHCQLSNRTKDKLYETFIIKTTNDLEQFDACLKKKKFF